MDSHQGQDFMSKFDDCSPSQVMMSLPTSSTGVPYKILLKRCVCSFSITGSINILKLVSLLTLNRSKTMVILLSLCKLRIMVILLI